MLFLSWSQVSPVQKSFDSEMKNAFEYIAEKASVDLNELGSLKRFRKKLNVNECGLLCWRNKVVIPEPLRSHYLRIAHDHPTSGYYAEDDAVNWIRSCGRCCEFNKHVYVNRPVSLIEINNRFEFVCYDIAGPFLPKNIRGNQYALIIVDHFTKWPEILPLKEATAPTIARSIFDQWCCRYGIMTRLHSDGAKNVHSGVIK